MTGFVLTYPEVRRSRLPKHGLLPVLSGGWSSQRFVRVPARRCYLLRAMCEVVVPAGKDSREAVSDFDEESASAVSTLRGVAVETEESIVCDACGRLGGPVGGCDGTGRVAGGFGAFVDWWPIKAYRPCPELGKAKKQYKRSGQSLDEIAFGRVKQ
jgi:hypothetical protein